MAASTSLVLGPSDSVTGREGGGEGGGGGGFS